MRSSSNSALPTTSSQLTGSPPAIYQAPKVNMGDLQTLHRVVSSELTKVARAQSYILSLWQKVAPPTVTREEYAALLARVTALEEKQELTNNLAHNNAFVTSQQNDAIGLLTKKVQELDGHEPGTPYFL